MKTTFSFIILVLTITAGLSLNLLSQSEKNESLESRIFRATVQVTYYLNHQDSILSKKFFEFQDETKKLIKDYENWLARSQKLKQKLEYKNKWDAYAYKGSEGFYSLPELDYLEQARLYAAWAKFSTARQQLHPEVMAAKMANPEFGKLRRKIQRRTFSVPEKVILNEYAAIPLGVASIYFPVFLKRHKDTVEGPGELHHFYYGGILYLAGITAMHYWPDKLRENIGLRVLPYLGMWLMADDYYQHNQQLSDGYPETPGSQMYHSPIRRVVYNWWFDNQRDVEPWQLAIRIKLGKSLFKSQDRLSLEFGHYQGLFAGVQYQLPEINQGSVDLPLTIVFGLSARAIMGAHNYHQAKKLGIGPICNVHHSSLPQLKLQFGLLRQFYLVEITEQPKQPWTPVFGISLGGK